jgi:hypothetical protein
MLGQPDYLLPTNSREEPRAMIEEARKTPTAEEKSVVEFAS